MKKFLIIPCFALITSVILFSCEKKKDSGVGPGFKEETGTGGNPFPNNPTVTGTSTNTNPATTSSFLQVGGMVGVILPAPRPPVLLLKV